MKNMKILMISMVLIIMSTNIQVMANETNRGYFRYKEGIKNILVVNSYSANNEWEKSITDGFIEFMNEQEEFIINIDNVYLDIKNNNNDREEYLESFEKLIRSKYQGKDFDLILTIDDDAYNLAKSQIFNEESIFYKKKVLFVGVNQEIYLKEEEEKYITGFRDVENLVHIINSILSLHEHANSIETINILTDNSVYNEKISKKLIGNKYLIVGNVEINFIKGDYTQDILEKIKYLDDENEAIIVSGLYKDLTTNKKADEAEFINDIKEVKNIPIYTDRQEYINKGVIGGFIDVGYENGHSAGKMAMEILRGKSILDLPVINEPVSQFIFNYEEIYEYKVNTLEIPKQSEIINKKPYQLLIPSQIKVFIMVILLLVATLVVGALIVITIEKKDKQETKKLYEMAKDREQLKTDFIANMSHELRTPLNVITSIVKLLELKVDKGEVDKEYLVEKLDRISQNSGRLIRLVNNLIDITKFDSGFYECKYENANIVYVIEDIVSESVDYANEKHIDIIFDTEEEEIITYIDQEKIERAVLNLISNAIKFTHEKGIIEVIVKQEQSSVIIKVKDSGIGIEEEKLKQVFHRFYQIDSLLNRRHEGSGLGLCIVDEIVKMHNGCIDVCSEVGVGTTFKLILPIKLGDETIEYKDIQNRDFKDIVKLEMSDIDK